jgi:methanogenic corrinoid protein MtbC1
MQKTVVAAALGECVHVAGVLNFLRLAEAAGWRTVFLGPAVPIVEVLESARTENADLIGVSYRLTPETGERLLGEFAEAADELHSAGKRFAFGGTPLWRKKHANWDSLNVYLMAVNPLNRFWRI